MRLVEGEGSVLDGEERLVTVLVKRFENCRPAGVCFLGRVVTRLGLARTAEWKKSAWKVQNVGRLWSRWNMCDKIQLSLQSPKQCAGSEYFVANR
jgi:hypothetical protein